MKLAIEVENIKCGGCVNSIQKKIIENNQIETVDVDVEKGIVNVTTALAQEDSKITALRQNLVQTLTTLGYPERGSVEGLAALKGKAKSFVSCAVGRISDS